MCQLEINLRATRILHLLPSERGPAAATKRLVASPAEAVFNVYHHIWFCFNGNNTLLVPLVEGLGGSLVDVAFLNPQVHCGVMQAIVQHICLKEPPGGILVFLTGWDDISSLMDLLMSNGITGDPNRVILLPLHSTMDSINQQLIFKSPPSGVRCVHFRSTSPISKTKPCLPSCFVNLV